MTRIRRLLAPVLLLGAAVAPPALAQTPHPFSVEARAGAVFPERDSRELDVGWIVDATLRYALTPGLDAYAGYSFGSSSLDLGDETVDVSVRDHGFRSGLRADLRVGTPKVTPWAEFGVLLNRTEVKASASGESDTERSKWGLGFEAGAGLSFPVAPRISLTPGIRYRTHKIEFEDSSGTGHADYIVVDLGVNVRI